MQTISFYVIFRQNKEAQEDILSNSVYEGSTRVDVNLDLIGMIVEYPTGLWIALKDAQAMWATTRCQPTTDMQEALSNPAYETPLLNKIVSHNRRSLVAFRKLDIGK